MFAKGRLALRWSWFRQSRTSRSTWSSSAVVLLMSLSACNVPGVVLQVRRTDASSEVAVIGGVIPIRTTNEPLVWRDRMTSESEYSRTYDPHRVGSGLFGYGPMWLLIERAATPESVSVVVLDPDHAPAGFRDALVLQKESEGFWNIVIDNSPIGDRR